MTNLAPVIKDYKYFYNQFRASLTESQFKKFKSFKSNEKKILFVANQEKCCMYPVNAEINHGKNMEEARILKNKGNIQFQNENYDEAFWFYSQAIQKSSLNLPDVGAETTVFFANRSATLYHLQKYELAIKDIDFALRNDYPIHLSYKLLDRKARCLLALKNHDSAIDVFKLTITALDESKLTTEKRQKWQKNIQIMLLMLEKNQYRYEKTSDEKRDTKMKKKDKPNSKYEAVKADIDIKFSTKMGRFAVAKSKINAGDIVVVEKAHCAVLLDTYRSTHCHHCFRRVKALYPCPTCDRIIFCSEKCAKYAISTYHQTECCVLNTLWESNISIICLMALRMITQHKLEFFLERKDHLSDIRQNQIKEYNSANYDTVCTLVTHEDERKPEDMINRIHMALFLMQCLRKTSYFQNSSATIKPNNEIGKIVLNNDELFITQRLLHHLQLLQFNAHEVSELVISAKPMTAPVSKFIGGALYPTLALFNHSCNPGIVRYFDGTKVIARAIRNIPPSEMVAENYGPIFMTSTKQERQQLMRDRYWFICECEACTHDWPTLVEIKNSNIRLRCSNTKCPGSIAIDPCNDRFFIKCTSCFENNNIIKALKVLQVSKKTIRRFILNEETNLLKKLI